MLALIALIVAVVVVGGGIELLRRARFGVGPSAAHHRALDTLGHITHQSADPNSPEVETEEPELLSHVRRAVEGDRAQPRIDPQPVSRPVAVPAITGGPNFVGTVPGPQASSRGPDTEIEGVRLLVPDAKPGGEGPEEAGGDDAEATGQMALPIDGEWDEDADWDPEADVDPQADWDSEADWEPEAGWDNGATWDSEAAWDDEGDWDEDSVWAEGHDRHGDDVTLQHTALHGADGTPLGNESAPPEEAQAASGWTPGDAGWVPDHPDHEAAWSPYQQGPVGGDPATWDPAAAQSAESATPGSWQGVAGWESVLHQAVGHPDGPAWGEPAAAPASPGWYRDEPGAVGDEDVAHWGHDDQAASPAGLPDGRGADATMASSGDPSLYIDDFQDDDPAPGAGDTSLYIDDFQDDDAPVASGAPTQQVRRIDDQPPEPAVGVGDGHDEEQAPAARVIRIDDLGQGGWANEPPAPPPIGEVGEDLWDGDDTGPEVARPSRQHDQQEADADELAPDDEHGEGDGQPIVMRFDDLGGTAEATTADPPDLRPQHVSAGADGHAGAIPGLTPDETRAQLAALAQSGGMGSIPGTRRRHHRRRRSPNQRHRLSSAAMILAAVLIFGGAVYLVATSSSGSHPHRAPTATHSPVTRPPAPSTTAPPAASLVSQNQTTATYQVAGSPTIGLQFNSSCWTEIRQNSSSGPIVFEGIESAGANRQLNGPVWVRLGNPTAVQVTVGGTALTQPPPQMTSGSPFNLQFQ